MRFYLDNDVDHRCLAVLRSAGHLESWAASDAGLSDAGDDDQTVYASDLGAVVITHDREYTERQKRNTAGRHVRLRCPQPDGPDLLGKWLPSIVTILGARRYVVIELKPDSFRLTSAWQ